MKLIGAFLKLIRWPNLLFIALTQGLFYFFVVSSFYYDITSLHYQYPAYLFYLLMTASVLIAAAGYIINDYFDLQIDAINKPTRVVVGTVIKRRWAIMWHLLLSTCGLLLSLFISYKTGKWVIVLANLLCILLLWFYSTTFKRKLLSGNIIISLLTAWVIVVVYFFAGASIIDLRWLPGEFPFDIKRFYKFTILYAGFAFVVSLIREVVKDLEDMHGDARYDCTTMPIEWGVPATKVFTAVWIVVCVGGLAIIQTYAWLSGYWIVSIYSIIAVIIPLLIILRRLYIASTPADYHKISSMVKLVMLAGILSMLFFKINVYV